ncbi:MAG: accessory gene regulator B family protein [Clostridiales bacterium]|uniref:accessory gene regulator ArgB-like protein n=1 Tax=Clostridium sp. N3C TaxID=1776758 RepID=UPI00092E1A00|nr:accessory gene regulator B family protein [Clostridium sp. N3C]NLZ49290.1 accessory gene regulator B family protein [Clostridiales bacterium]SCN23811.1 Membrane protein putatively involved in post-translational modification of the autoinducing quorum-sensing peptide [Clostridium sp. N3C]
MRALIKKISHRIAEVNKYTKDQEEQIEYAMKICSFELIKIFLVILIFSLLGYASKVIVAMIVMITTRSFIGGYHEDNQVKCFVATFLINAGVIYLGCTVHIGIIGKIIIYLLALFCIWNQAPIVNPLMPITREELLRRNKIVGTTITLIFVIISIVFENNKDLSNVILWMIVFQVMLMFNKEK